jgi:hypothetical protein
MATLGRKANSRHTSISRNRDLASMPSGLKCRLLIVNGRACRAAVPVVPQSLLCPPVTPDPGPALSSYGVNAAFMLFQPRESGIHVVRPGAGGASVTEARFGTPRSAARREWQPRST